MDFAKRYQYDGAGKFSLKDCPTCDLSEFHKKSEAAGDIARNIKKLSVMQDMLYAQTKHAILIVFQALDAAGKDSTIKHVMSGINPQGCHVVSFKTPSAEELDHDYMWRINKNLPARGHIGIFNRSHYEEVLITRVHPEFVLAEKIPGIDSVNVIGKDFWEDRFEDIRNYEKYLSRNGFTIIKFFLHVSKDEQKKRFLKRINMKEKNWKLSASDMKERALWDEYQQAFEDAIAHTSTEKNPWYIVPADKKWFMRLAVSEIINERMEKLDLHYPTVPYEQVQELEQIKGKLLDEK